MKDEDTEANQSKDLKKNNTWLFTAANIYEWETERQTKRQTRYRRLRYPTQLLATTRHHQQKHHHTYNCNTTALQFIADSGNTTTKAQWSSSRCTIIWARYTKVYEVWAKCHEWQTHYAVCSMPYTRTNGPLTPPGVQIFNISLRDCSYSIEFATLPLQRSRHIVF